MSLDDYVKKFLDNPDIEDSDKDNIRSLVSSHLITGMRLQEKGLLREAIEEFAKENNRSIKSDIDKEIAQKSYVQIGVAYRKLGEIENAKTAFEKARELWKLYGLGSAPHYDLAEILIEQGQLDEAIVVCQELVDDLPDSGVELLLAKAIILKKGNIK
jgi:tetratricopeptide (TPR) repeat protein